MELEGRVTDRGLFERIVVGLDLSVSRAALSEGSERALEQVLALVSRGCEQVTLLHATRADERWDPAAKRYVHVAGPISREQEQVLDRAAGRVRMAGGAAKVVCIDRHPVTAILAQCMRERADLVVVGKRSDDSGDGRRLGSVSMKLLRKCPAPIWAVKGGRSPNPSSILAATDLTPVGDRVIDLAGRVAAGFAADLHVVSAYQLPLSVQMEGVEAEEDFDRTRSAQIVGSIRSRLAERGLADSAHLHVGRTSPVSAIEECVYRVQPDLVVMGTISRSGIAGLVVGNTAERLLGRLDCSLLTLKPADFRCPTSLEELDASLS